MSYFLSPMRAVVLATAALLVLPAGNAFADAVSVS